MTGVLVALGAQSLWNRAQDAGHETEYLTQLRKDLVRTSANLERNIAAQEVSIQRAERLRHALRSADDAPSDSIALWTTHRLGDAEVVTTALDALLQSGNVYLIDDDTTRLAIIEYAATLAAAERGIERVGNAYFDRSARARGLLEQYSSYATASSWQDTTTRVPLIDTRGLRNDPAVRAAYMDVLLSLSNTRGRMRDIKDASDSLVRVLDRKRR